MDGRLLRIRLPRLARVQRHRASLVLGRGRHRSATAILGRRREATNRLGAIRREARQSNTEPLLRLNLEGLTPEIMEKRRDAVLSISRS
jgi:phosphoglucomutase/phosphomannomutase-like protein